MRMNIDAECFGAASHIADAHGAGIRVTAYLAEGLHLHGADKGDECIRKDIQLLRQKSDKKQQRNLRQNDDLPPMHLFHVLIVPADRFRYKDAEYKCKQRHEIAPAVRPISFEEIGTEKNDISCLRICEHLAAAEVGIGVLETAGKNNK